MRCGNAGTAGGFHLRVAQVVVCWGARLGGVHPLVGADGVALSHQVRPVRHHLQRIGDEMNVRVEEQNLRSTRVQKDIHIVAL